MTTPSRRRLGGVTLVREDFAGLQDVGTLDAGRCRGAEPDELDETLEEGRAMAKAQEGEIATHADGVMVLSVWRQGTEGFLGRMTATTQDGGSTIKVVASQEELLQSVREWLDLLG